MITAILNAYKRQEFLNKQIDCVLSQSIVPEKVMVWNNGSTIGDNDYPNNVVLINSVKNFGVWARFAFALNADTEYICILDDDTFPGKNFFKSCLETMDNYNALIGARGLRFFSNKQYEPHQSFGWDSPNSAVEFVDIVGHAWFFRREWLSYFWREIPALGTTRLVGEDMHFSAMLQKYADIPTVVSPHPQDDQSLWGSDPAFALDLGTGTEAISQTKDSMKKFDKALKYYTSNGFMLLKDKGKPTVKRIIIPSKIVRSQIVRSLITRHPKLHAISKYIVNRLAKYNIHV